MVFGNQGLPVGPLSEETMQRLALARKFVIGIWICALVRVVSDNPFNGISTGFAAITGTYTFMNDKRLTGCYDFMFANCVVCGGGGVGCMGPFISICLINSVFDTVRLFSLVTAGVALEEPITSVSILMSVIFQSVCLISCLRVYKELVHSLDSPLNDHRIPFLSSQPRGYVSLAADPSDQHLMGGFVPFAGQGRRLG